MSLPVIFFHKGNHKYLKVAIRRAKATGNTVYLLGDSSNRKFCADWTDLNDISSDRVELFKSIYVHMSKNPKEFELLCILRYFYLYEFMKKKNLDGIILMDSDCLVYKKYDRNEYTFCDCAFGWDFEQKPNYICPSSCYWTVGALKKFTDYCVDLYQNQLDVLKEKWATFGRRPGGISDITLLHLWFHSNPDVTIYNLNENPSVLYEFVPGWDHDKRHLYQYNKFTGLLKIKFVNNKPYFIKNDGSLQEVNNLHMHGGKKVYMSLLSRKITGGPAFYCMECVRRIKRNVVNYLINHRARK